MPQVDFTLDDLKQVFAAKEDLKPFATKEDLKGFATKEDLRVFATKGDLKGFATKDDMQVGFGMISAKIDGVKGMLEDDARAEMKRLDRVDRRSAKTLRLL